MQEVTRQNLTDFQGQSPIAIFGNARQGQFYGAGFSMEYAQRIIGKMPPQGVPMCDFESRLSKAEDEVPAAYLVNKGCAEQFAYCNPAFIKKHWLEFQIALQASEAACLGARVKMVPWPFIELSSQKAEHITMLSGQSLPGLRRHELRVKDTNKAIRQELERFKKPVIVTNNQNIVGYLFPLSMEADLKNLGDYTFQVVNSRFLREPENCEHADRVLIVSGPLGTKLNQDPYYLFVSDVSSTAIRECVQSFYPDTVHIPPQEDFFDSYIEDGKAHNAVTKPNRRAAAFFIKNCLRAINPEKPSDYVAINCILNPSGSKRPFAFFSDPDVKRLLYSAIALSHRRVSELHVADRTGLSWVLEYQFGVTQEKYRKDLIKAMGRVWETQRPYFGKNIITVKSPWPVSVTSDPVIAGAADRIMRIKNFGINGP